jgi:hypothetical protein
MHAEAVLTTCMRLLANDGILCCSAHTLSTSGAAEQQWRPKLLPSFACVRRQH